MDFELPLNNNPELKNIKQVAKLPSELGFIINELDPRLSEFRNAALEAMTARDWDTIHRKLATYQEAAERVISEKQGEAYTRAQIALIVDTALMWYEAGKIDSYANDIWNARNYAQNMEYKDITDILDPAWEEVEPIQTASEQWHAKKTTEEMATDALEYFQQYSALVEEINVRTNLKPQDFLADIVNVFIVYGIKDPLKILIELGWADE